MTKKITWALVGVLAALAGCACFVEYGHAAGNGARRVILPDQIDDPHFHASYWPVSKADALRADAGVRAYLLTTMPSFAPKLDTYYGQIIGYELGGTRLVHLNYVCPEEVRSLDGTGRGALLRAALSSPWKKKLAEIPEEGECRFSLDFDPTTGTYQSLGLRFVSPAT